MKYKNFLDTLSSKMQPYQAQAELSLILESVGISQKDFLINSNISKEKLEKINNLISTRLTSGSPIQHILGYSYFMGEKFLVSSDVLIPRPETELLVEQICNFAGNSLLDIGTGSGCIAIIIEKLSQKNVTACDISPDALAIATKNAQNLNAQIKFLQSDLFENINSKFDIIVSNPPYIPYSTKLEEEVLKEPHLALFAQNNGLEFYEKIIAQAPSYLTHNGILAFEIGVGQSLVIKELMTNANFENIKIINDYAQIPRIVIGNLT